jgi:hypothetical protein
MFLSSFNPATSGMKLLLTERMDRALFQSKPRKRRVSVNLKKCRWQLSTSIFGQALLSIFPAVDELIFNSICAKSDAPLIVDTGASCCITPNRDDFVTYYNSKAKVKDLSGVNPVAGEGMVSWKVFDRNGQK